MSWSSRTSDLLRERFDLDPTLAALTIRRHWRKASPLVKRGAFALALAFLHTYLNHSPVGFQAERTMRELWFSLRGTRAVPQSVSIVRLDKLAYDVVQKPAGEKFPRDRMGEALKKIAAANPRMVILDFFASTPGDSAALDEKFAEGIAAAPTYLGRSYDELVSMDPDGNSTRKVVLRDPVAALLKGAAGVLPMQVSITKGMVEQICLREQEIVQGGPNPPVILALRPYLKPDFDPPRMGDLINYYGHPGMIPSVSLGEMLDDRAAVSPEYFRDRVVFVGVQTTSNVGIEAKKDMFITPASHQQMYGVEVHATIAANILDTSWIKRLNPGLEALILYVTVLLGAYGLLMLRPIASLAGALCLGALWLGLSYGLFVGFYYFIPGATAFALLLPSGFLLRVALSRALNRIALTPGSAPSRR